MTHKIYTKTGDQGETSLLGGIRVSKSHIRIEAYGTVDELNAHIGLIRDQTIPRHEQEFLLEIQDRLFTIGSLLASAPDAKAKIPELTHGDVSRLEMEMDKMDKELTPLKNFILPGGHPVVSYCHIARCVCRRAERAIVALSMQEAVNELIIIYMNRLSDYLFMLSRWISRFYTAPETPWKPQVR